MLIVGYGPDALVRVQRVAPFGFQPLKTETDMKTDICFLKTDKQKHIYILAAILAQDIR